MVRRRGSSAENISPVLAVKATEGVEGEGLIARRTSVSRPAGDCDCQCGNKVCTSDCINFCEAIGKLKTGGSRHKKNQNTTTYIRRKDKLGRVYYLRKDLRNGKLKRVSKETVNRAKKRKM